MCPDIEAFAPLIQATFGAGEVAPDAEREAGATRGVRPPDLRVRLADRALRQTNPRPRRGRAAPRAGDGQADGLAGARPRRPRAGAPAVRLRRRRPRAARGLGVGERRALGSRRRAPRAVPARAVSQPGTWRAGLDRLLLGVTMTEDGQRLVGDVLPLDDVDERRDRPRRPVRRVRRSPRRGGRPARPTRSRSRPGRTTLGEAADALTATATAGGLAARRAPAPPRRRRRRGRPTATPDAELRARRDPHPARRSPRGRPTRANFRTGHLTICTLVPMRSVPHRVVCLLGLDDGAFPRHAPRDGDDLTLARAAGRRARRAQRGPPAPARRAAGGHRPADRHLHGQRRAHEPAAAAGGARSASCSTSIDRTVERGRPARPRDAVVVAPPAAAVRPAQLHAGALVPGRPWSFDSVDLDGARGARRAARRPVAVPRRRRCRTRRGRSSSSTTSSASSSTRCARSCASGSGVASFGAERRARGRAADRARRPASTWRIGQRLLEARLRGRRLATRRGAPRSRAATLPPGELGAAGARARSTRSSRASWRGRRCRLARRRRRSLDVRSAAAATAAILTRNRGRRPRRRAPRRRRYSRVSPRHRLAAWVRFLRDVGRLPGAAVRGGHDRPGDARGRAGHGRAIPPLGADAAARRGGALDAPRRARRPLRPRHARAAADRLPDVGRLRGGGRGRPRRREAAARARWETDVQARDGEDRDRAPCSCSAAASARFVDRWRHAARRRGGRPGRRASRAASAVCAPALWDLLLGRSRRRCSRMTTRPFDVCGAAADAASPCSRRVPAPARPTRSRRWRPATSPTAPRSTTC